MLYAKNGENVEVKFVKEKCLIGELASYYSVLEYLSEGNNLDNGFITTSDGIIEINGEGSEEIELILKFE